MKNCESHISTIRNFVVVALAIALGACQTMITPLRDAKQVPSDRVFFTEKATSENPATVIFIRDSGVLGIAVGKRVFINDVLAANLEAGEMVAFKLDPGEYIFAARSGPDSTVLANSPAYIDQRLEAGKTYYYRLYSDMNKPGQIGRVTAKSLQTETP